MTIILDNHAAVFPLAKVAHAPNPDVWDSILAQVARQLESKTKVQVDKSAG